MPRSLIRSTKSNHGQKAKRNALAVPLAAPQAIDLSDLRQRHPEITDAQARLAAALAIDGLSMQECSTQMHLPPEWVRSQIAKAPFTAFAQELALLVVGSDALSARSTMRSLLRARSAYVRYAAAQDLMDRAGLRVRPAAVQQAAASITINIGDVGAKPSTGLVTIVEDVPSTQRVIDTEGPHEPDPS